MKPLLQGFGIGLLAIVAGFALSAGVISVAAYAAQPEALPPEPEPTRATPRNEPEWAEWIRDFHYPDAKLETQLFDGTRVDIETEYEAIEVDWPHKWAEGIGQASYYSRTIEKRGVLILLAAKPKESASYIYRAKIAGGGRIEVRVFDTTKKQFARIGTEPPSNGKK